MCTCRPAYKRAKGFTVLKVAKDLYLGTHIKFPIQAGKLVNSHFSHVSTENTDNTKAGSNMFVLLSSRPGLVSQ